MTLQHTIDYVKQHFPKMGSKEIRLSSDTVMRDFCSETGLVENSYSMASAAGVRYYALPDTIHAIKEVHLNDVIIPRLKGKPIVDDDEFLDGTPAGDTSLPIPTAVSKNRYWYTDLARIGIVEDGSVTKEKKTADYQSISESNIQIRIICIDSAGDLENSETAVYEEIPPRFREAIIFGIISRGYLNGATGVLDPKLSQFFESKYEKGIKKAK